MSGIRQLSLNRRELLVVAASLSTLLLPIPARAKQVDKSSGDFTVQEGDYFVTKKGRFLCMTELSTGKTTFAEQSEDGTELFMTDVHGNCFTLVRRTDGNVYKNNELYIAYEVEPIVQTRAVPSGYEYLVRWRGSTQLSDTIGSITLALIGLFPGMAGPATVAGVIASIGTYTRGTVYIEITQYYNPNTYWIYQITRLYSNSNYTGLLSTIEKGPFKPVQ